MKKNNHPTNAPTLERSLSLYPGIESTSREGKLLVWELPTPNMCHPSVRERGGKCELWLWLMGNDSRIDQNGKQTSSRITLVWDDFYCRTISTPSKCLHTHTCALLLNWMTENRKLNLGLVRSGVPLQPKTQSNLSENIPRITRVITLAYFISCDKRMCSNLAFSVCFYCTTTPPPQITPLSTRGDIRV